MCIFKVWYFALRIETILQLNFPSSLTPNLTLNLTLQPINYVRWLYLSFLFPLSPLLCLLATEIFNAYEVLFMVPMASL